MKLSENIKNNTRPFVIAGPCSAESEEQVMSVCKEIAENNSAQSRGKSRAGLRPKRLGTGRARHGDSQR